MFVSKKQMKEVYEDIRSKDESGSKSGPRLSPIGQNPCSTQHANHKSYSVGIISPR